MFLLILLAVTASAGISDVFFVKDHDSSLRFAYDPYSQVFGIGKVSLDLGTADSFAEDLCVAPTDVNVDSLSLESSSAGVPDQAGLSVPYAKQIHERRYPASLTKIMTCLVAS